MSVKTRSRQAALKVFLGLPKSEDEVAHDGEDCQGLQEVVHEQVHNDSTCPDDVGREGVQDVDNHHHGQDGHGIDTEHALLLPGVHHGGVHPNCD